MYWTRDKLFELLPMLYRSRDAEIAAQEGLDDGPLGALLTVIAEQLSAMEANIEQSYDNHFVETCEPWALAYLGNLIGIEQLPTMDSNIYTPRAFVANMLSYRRRKGTPGMLEQLARDSTSWYARVTEYFLLLDQTRHLNRSSGREFMPNLRALEPLETLNSPFSATYRLPEVRNIDSPHPGRFNIPSVGIHLWPLRAFSPPDATGAPTDPAAPFAVEARPSPMPAAPGDSVARWYLHPFGQPFPLFNRPLSRDPSSGAEITALAEPRDVPDPLRRLPLYNELEALRQAIADGVPRPTLEYLGSDKPVFQFFTDNSIEPIPAEMIRIVDFSQGWPQPAAVKSYQPAHGGVPVDLPIVAAFDPAKGQIAFAPGAEPQRLRTIYANGFSAELGGGSYDRQNEQRTVQAEAIEWQIGVSRLHAPEAGKVVSSLAAAVSEWNAQPAGTIGMICVLDSMRYEEDLTSAARRIRIPSGSQLTLIAADWPRQETDPGIFERLTGSFSPNFLRPHLLGDLEIIGSAPSAHSNPGAFHFEGFALEGSVNIAPGHLGSLRISHCAQPLNAAFSIAVNATVTRRNQELKIEIRDSIVPDIRIRPNNESLKIFDSIIGIPEAEAAALIADSIPITLNRCTFWGNVRCLRIDASECIFMAAVEATQTQIGCIRYSYLGAASHVPRQYRCQPNKAIRDAGAQNNPSLSKNIRLRVRPQFASTDPYAPTFARLKESAAVEIREGGENASEMGVLNQLKEPHRRRFLANTLDEFLRAGMQAGLIFETTRPTINYGQKNT